MGKRGACYRVPSSGGFPISSCLACCLQSWQGDETLGSFPKTSSIPMLWLISFVKVTCALAGKTSTD